MPRPPWQADGTAAALNIDDIMWFHDNFHPSQRGHQELAHVALRFLAHILKPYEAPEMITSRLSAWEPPPQPALPDAALREHVNCASLRRDADSAAMLGVMLG